MMKKLMMKKFSSLILCMMLIVAMALCATGCGDKQESPMTGETLEAESSQETEAGEEGDSYSFKVEK